MMDNKMNNTNDKAINQLSDLGLDMTPRGAGYHIGKVFAKKGISVSKAGEVMSVSHTTVSRLIKGGSLTEDMALKLVKHYDFSADMLFNLEAAYHAHNVDQILMHA